MTAWFLPYSHIVLYFYVLVVARRATLYTERYLVELIKRFVHVEDIFVVAYLDELFDDYIKFTAVGQRHSDGAKQSVSFL